MRLAESRDALLGRTLWEAFPGVIGSLFEGPYREAMATGRVTSAEAYFEPLGTWFDLRSYPWVGGRMVHFRDIGARKAAEAERERLLAEARAARSEAEAANQAKAHFLATMSHELRTPLNAIGGYAEPMEMGIRGPVTPQRVEDLRRVQASQRHLLGFVNEVLDYARIETGTVRYEVADVHLAAVVARVVDTGMGIAPEELERVFEPFVQVDAALTRTHEGTGLALAISRDLARGMRGDLTARSTVGRGSTFTVTLPRAR